MYISVSYWRKLWYYLLILGMGILAYVLAVQVAFWTQFTPVFLPQVDRAVVIPVNSQKKLEAALKLAQVVRSEGYQVVVVDDEFRQTALPSGQVSVLRNWQWSWLNQPVRHDSTQTTVGVLTDQIQLVSTRLGRQVLVVKDLDIDSQRLVKAAREHLSDK